MADHVEILGWDSDFFGFPIGRVDLDDASDEDLAAIEEEARQNDLRCLYASQDPADAGATMTVQARGYRFVEAATTFDLQLDEPPIAEPEGFVFRLGGPDDLGATAPIASRLAPWSRFAVDPGFGPEAAERLQQASIRRAATCDTGERQLVVAERDGEILAFITRCATPEPVVDAVGTTRRGSGAARFLIEDARAWAGDRPLLGGPIAARNVNALRYVSHCGYRVATVRYLYHRWFDEVGDGNRGR